MLYTYIPNQKFDPMRILVFSSKKILYGWFFLDFCPILKNSKFSMNLTFIQESMTEAS